MFDILHRVGIKSASPRNVYLALTTLDGLCGWWTGTTQGTPSIDGTIMFRFGDRGGFDMRVIELVPEQRVVWKVVEGPAEWIGTMISFDLSWEEDQTTVLFKHSDWKERVEFMHHCSTKWATFLMSLKAFVETGKGAPFPNDVHITANAD